MRGDAARNCRAACAPSARNSMTTSSTGPLRSAIRPLRAWAAPWLRHQPAIRRAAGRGVHDIRHRVSRDLRMRLSATGSSAGWRSATIAGAPDFGLTGRDCEPRAARYAVLLHSSRAAGKGMAGGELDRARPPGLPETECDLVPPWGTPVERALSERIAAAHAARAPRRNRAPLDAVAASLPGLNSSWGVDTGLLHLAAALGVPLVGDLRRQPAQPDRSGRERAARCSAQGAPPSFGRCEKSGGRRLVRDPAGNRFSARICAKSLKPRRP